ncbi:MAG: GH92 family glycosyl hydrolase [Bacteroidales bacterium]|nr:GH92 family glycosyl hydrolase [Bacteroidales bacterium]
MKTNLKNIFAALLLVSLAAPAAARSHDQIEEPVDYVNPYIGSISHLLVPCFPTIQLPNSLMRIYPTRGDYTTEMLDGLPVVVTNHRERSAFRLSIIQGDELRHIIPVTWDNEHITPYDYQVQVADNSINVHLAVSHQSAIYEFTFQEPSKSATIVLFTDNGHMLVEGRKASASQRLSRNMRIYFSGEFNVEPEQVGLLRDGKISGEKVTEEPRACGAVRFPAGTKKVIFRYGVSLISAEQAEKNLSREQGREFNLSKVAKAGRKEWNETLSNILVEGGTANQKAVMYTAYYRTFERPVCLSEDGRYFSAFDGKVHDDEGQPFYTDDWIWDTYRAAHPLRALIQPTKEENIIESYLRMAEQMGTNWMPTFPEMTGDTRRMNSNHGVAMVADALWKGLKVDAERAFEYCKKGIEEKTLAPWSGKPAGWIDYFYKDHGYIPALAQGEEENDPNVSGFEKRQPVAVTLGTSYDEWCLSRIAEFLDRKDEAAKYLKLSYNYHNLWNPETKFFHPKDKEGNFLPDFDYRFGGGIGARDAYDENNGWTYRWDVQHNLADLANLMGGREEMARELDRTFAEPMGRGKREFYEQLPDQTGNIGQFTMANEPSLHIPYIYNYAGAPWKTQKRIRQCLDTWFRNDVMGIPGDEDGGGLTSFAVFSSLGFYPVTPGFPVFNIGSPIFTDIRIKLPGGKELHIIARGSSRDNKYIQRATLNGKTWNKPWFSQEDIKNGATLVLEMGSQPNKQWGTDESAVPPSAAKSL